MNTSTYQLVKIHVLSFFDLTKDAMHIYIGLSAFLLWVLVTRKSLGLWKNLIPVLIAAMLMETFDLRDDFNSFGHFRWSASLHDVLNTVFWPAIIVILFKFRLIK
ncbi:MAG: hypothetical protein JW896_05680 [Deltaproteobacteria bacterium]|nr:hypothetical protein [Deltaproteobacteria bacterium]